MLPVGEVIAIGDELTSGQRLDTNSQWISQRLAALGVRVLFHSTVGDDLAANMDVFRTAIGRADVIVSTGGLGPTADDLTREALAAVAGVELVQDDEALDHIRGLFVGRGREMPPRNVVQALFPRGSRQILNPQGTAPGIEMVFPRPDRIPCQLIALPGVPAELFVMWDTHVAPALISFLPTRRVIRHRAIKCFGAGESQIEAMLPDMIRRGREPLVGITASSATITLRITATAENEAACLALMEPTIKEIHEKLGLLIFGEDEVELEHAVVSLLASRHKTVSTCERGTGGLLAELFATADPDGRAFVGGSVFPQQAASYNLGGPTEATRAEALAQYQHSGASYGLAVWQVGSADGQTARSTVHVALSDASATRVKEYPVFGDPTFMRIRTAKLALNQLRLALLRAECETTRQR
jgi:nicotinamide-nucleotide amidase